MIEIICREDLQKGEEDASKEKRSMPKNIRQVGSPRGRHKIYIEDYVYTYIQNMPKKSDPCAAIFLGTAQVDRDIRCTFISGAVECSSAVFQWDSIKLDDSFWDYIYKAKKQYFADLEIVGWFLGRAGQPMELPAAVESAHRKYFAGRDKLLMLMDPLEEEEIFFVHEQGCLQKREGYYIYYEKNLPMQEYMVSRHEEERLASLTDWQEAPEDSDAMPRTGEFASLYQDLQQADASDSRYQGRQPKDVSDSRYQGRQPTDASDSHYQQAQPGNVSDSHTQEMQPPEHFTGRTEDLSIRQPQKLFQEILGIQNRTLKGADGSQDSKQASASHHRHRKALQRQEQLQASSINKPSPTEQLDEPWEKIFARNNEIEPKTQAEEALESYRNMLLERQSRQIARQNRSFLYTASAFFLVVLCVMGITTVNNYHKMQEVEETLHILKSTGNPKEGSQDSTADADSLVVENIPSQVKPLEEAGSSADTQPEAKNSQNAKDSGQSEKQKGSEKSGSAQQETSEKTDSSQDTSETSASQQDRIRYYTVQPGDTLDSICLSIYNSLEVRDELCQLNGIEDGNKIFTGQKLQLP